jgi:Xaa-Pro dipeptidase
MSEEFFSASEYDARLSRLRDMMATRGVDVCLISAPENIFYLVGLDHWGYFAPHILIVPAQGEMTLVTRAMERVTIHRQVRNARFEGHSDSETAASAAVRVLRDLGLGSSMIGVEAWSAGLPHGLAEMLTRGLAEATWTDITSWVDDLRLVKSPAEQAYMRAAARVSDATATAAIEAIREGASERDVAARAFRLGPALSRAPRAADSCRARA